MCICVCVCCAAIINVKGAHSPGPRALSMGLYPVQTLNSQILDQDDVSTQIYPTCACTVYMCTNVISI